MVYNLIVAFTFIGILAMLFYSPYLYSAGLLKISMGQLFKEDKLKCFIPIYNTIYAENMYTGRISKIAIGAIVLLVTFILRCAVLGGLYTIVPLQYISLYGLYVGIIAFIIMNSWAVFTVLYDADITSLPITILYSLLFPIGQYYIGTYLPGELASVQKKKSVFK